MAGNVTSVLASYWPSITDLSGSSNYGLIVSGRKMSTPPTLLIGYDTLNFYVYLGKSFSWYSQQINVSIIVTILLVLQYMFFL